MGTPATLPERDRMPMPPLKPLGGGKADESHPSYLGPPAMSPPIANVWTVMGLELYRQRMTVDVVEALTFSQAEAVVEEHHASPTSPWGWLATWTGAISAPMRDNQPSAVAFKDHRS